MIKLIKLLFNISEYRRPLLVSVNTWVVLHAKRIYVELRTVNIYFPDSLFLRTHWNSPMSLIECHKLKTRSISGRTELRESEKDNCLHGERRKIHSTQNFYVSLTLGKRWFV